MPPCEPWIDAADVAACCGVALSTENEGAYEEAAELGTLVAWKASGHRFGGICGPVTVRPCGDECGCWTGVQWLSYPDGTARPLWTGTEWNWNTKRFCGCSCLPKVRLSGYVQAIDEVKIDGVIIDPDSYRVDRRRWLVRTNGQHWPSCQDDSLEDDQPGTFSVSYTYGQEPDELGRSAAAALGCEFFAACSEDDMECKLPQGAVRIVRQGVTIDRLQPLASMLQKGETGILAWDAFISEYGGAKAKAMRATFYAPGGSRAAPRFGLPGP